MKNYLVTLLGTIGSFAASMFGGWTTAMTTLLIFMGIDYVTGLVCAGIFHKSAKTETGALDSNVSFKGLCKKGIILLIVLMAYRLDLAMGGSFVRDAACIAFILNEAISIIENAGLMGVPVPKIIKKTIDVLKRREGENEEEKE